jgi:phasin family protein
MLRRSNRPRVPQLPVRFKMISNPFSEAQKASVDVLFGLGSKALDDGQQLVELSMQTLKASLADLSESAQAVLSVKSPQELVSLQSAGFQSASEKVASYGRHVQQIVTDASTSQREAIESKLASLQEVWSGAFQGVFENAPSGAEQALALMKSSLSAASQAYENASQSSKRVTDAVDATIVSENTQSVARKAKAS